MQTFSRGTPWHANTPAIRHAAAGDADADADDPGDIDAARDADADADDPGDGVTEIDALGESDGKTTAATVIVLVASFHNVFGLVPLSATATISVPVSCCWDSGAVHVNTHGSAGTDAAFVAPLWVTWDLPFPQRILPAPVSIV
jgi:hypothetical protein